jgi:hypothetical protein
MFRHILVQLDESAHAERALPLAARLACASDPAAGSRKYGAIIMPYKKQYRALITEANAPDTKEKLKLLVYNNMLLRRQNVLITPHSAFNSQEAQHCIPETTVANVCAFLVGHSQNRVKASDRWSCHMSKRIH